MKIIAFGYALLFGGILMLLIAGAAMLTIMTEYYILDLAVFMIVAGAFIILKYENETEDENRGES